MTQLDASSLRQLQALAPAVESVSPNWEDVLARARSQRAGSRPRRAARSGAGTRPPDRAGCAAARDRQPTARVLRPLGSDRGARRRRDSAKLTYRVSDFTESPHFAKSPRSDDPRRWTI